MVTLCPPPDASADAPYGADAGDTNMPSRSGREPLRIVVEWGATMTTVRLDGQLDLATVELAQQTFDVVRATGPTCVIADLRELTFCSCRGLDVLLMERSALREVGGDLLLVGPPPEFLRLLGLLGLAGVFTVKEPPL